MLKYKLKIRQILTFFFCLIFSGILHAQDTIINYNDLVSMPLKDILKIKVIGVSKYEEATNEAPANVRIVTKEQIKANCYQDLSDLLKNVTGVDLVDNARGYGEYYIFRGIEGNDRFLVLIDGQKINPVSGTFLSVGNSIALNSAERVEIIFGPSSVIYGADAYAGVINIITKTPQDELFVSAKSDYGSLNSINGELTTLFKPSDDFSISLFARYFQSDGPDFTDRDSNYMKILEYEPPLKNQFEQPIFDHTILLKAKYKNFTVSYFRQRFNEGNAFNQNQMRNIYNKENKWALDNNLLWLNYEKQFEDKSNLSFSLTYINHVQDPETQFYKRNTSVVPHQPFSQYLTGKDNSIRAQLIYNKDFFKRMKFVTGLDYEFSKSIPPYANDEVLGKSVKFEGENAETIEKNQTIEEQRIGGFAQLTYSLLKSLNVVLGGRYDYSLRYNSTFNPRASLIYNPFKNTSFKFLYGTAFQSPSLFYQYEQWGAAVAVMLSVDEIQQTDPTWNLENQLVKTFELTGNQVINEKVNINISAYTSILENLIERTTYTTTAYNKYFSTPDTTIYSLGFRNENIGKQNISGFDFKTEYSVTDNFFTYFSYSYINAFSIKETKNEPISRIARHKYWFGFVYNNLFDYLTISARCKYVGKMNNRNATVFPTGKQP